jgi:hypothetical protein
MLLRVTPSYRKSPELNINIRRLSVKGHASSGRFRLFIEIPELS